MANISRDQFHRNYYNWALSTAEQEVSEDFPLVRLIKGTGAARYLSYMSALPFDTRMERAKMLVKRMNGGICRKTLSAEENIEAEKYTQYFLNYPCEKVFGPLNPVPGIKTKYKIDARKLSKMVRQNLTDICGDPDKRPRSEWFHTRKFGGWTMLTWIHVRGTNNYQMRYGHSFLTEKNEPAGVSVDALRWMGATHAVWNLLELGDEEQALHQLVKVCTYFVEAVPRILELE
jgi:hypothetical protein